MMNINIFSVPISVYNVYSKTVENVYASRPICTCMYNWVSKHHLIYENMCFAVYNSFSNKTDSLGF